MMTSDDLSAYLGRLGYSGPISPSCTMLAALQLAHLHAIPFETIDSFTGSSPRLDLPSLVAKLVRSRRGGYCFEHNLLFQAVLRAFGFSTVGLLGRVLLGSSEDAETARTHMLLRVACDSCDLIVDVGFGGQVPVRPLHLVPDLVQDIGHEAYRLDRSGVLWNLRAFIDGSWRLLYRFALEPAFMVDYEVGNHYVATHPSSSFARSLVAARILPRGRLTLLNRRMTEHSLDGPSRIEDVLSDAILRDVLAQRFKIELDDRTWGLVVTGLTEAEQH